MARKLSGGNSFVVMTISLCLLLTAGVLAKDSKKAAWENTLGQAGQAMVSGNYAESHALLDQALEISRKFPTGDPRLGGLWHQLGELYMREANYDLAKEYFERALVSEQKSLGPDHSAVADSLAGLAACCEKRGDHVRAELFLARAMEIWRKQSGPEHPRLIGALPAMATYATLDNDLPRAQKLYEQLIAAESRTQPSGNTHLGTSLNLMAGLLASRGQYQEAEPMAQKAVDILGKADGQSIACDSARENLIYIEKQLGKPLPDFAGTGEAKTTSSSEKPAPTDARDQRLKTSLLPPADTSPHQPLIVHTDTKAVLRPPDTVPVTAIAADFHPWEVNAEKTPAGTGSGAHPAGWGRIKYLSGGKLITPEEYKAMLLTNQAYEMIKTEKYRMAVEILNKALAQCPHLASAHTNLGLALVRLGENEPAVEHLKQAIALDPARPAPWINLASAFQLSGHLTAALATTQEFLRRFPTSAMASKVKDLSQHLALEVNNQARVQKTTASAQASKDNDYFPYATEEGRRRWSPQHNVLKVYVGNGADVKGFKKEYPGLLKDAFKQWSDASKGTVAFEFVNKPDKADIECAWGADPTQTAAPAEGGEARLVFANGLIEHARITVLTCDPSPDSPLSANQVKAACLHEIGHALGLSGHSPNARDIMYCSMPLADVKISVSDRDAQTLKRLYGEAISFNHTPADGSRCATQV